MEASRRAVAMVHDEVNPLLVVGGVDGSEPMRRATCDAASDNPGEEGTRGRERGRAQEARVKASGRVDWQANQTFMWTCCKHVGVLARRCMLAGTSLIGYRVWGRSEGIWGGG